MSPTPSDPGSARDAETVRLIVRGDAEGLYRLLADHAGKVKGALRKEFGSLIDSLEIDEAISHASLRIWRKGARFAPERGALPAWFLTIARNCARRIIECRQRHAASPLTEAALARPYAIAPSSVEERPRQPRRNLLAQIQQCIDELPPLQRAVLQADLAAGGTAPTAQLAQQLGTTANSIYVSRSYGRKAVREAMIRPLEQVEIDGLTAEGFA